MNSQPDLNSGTAESTNQFTPSSRSLMTILGGCLFSILLLLFLFQNILNLPLIKQNGSTQQDDTHKVPPANVVSTRTQPEAPTFFLDRMVVATNRSDSKKNLRQINRAVIDYYKDRYRYPPHAMFKESVHPNHGWQTAILPFLGEAELYSKINLKMRWTHPVNYNLFQQQVPVYLNPLITEKVTPDGLALSHYVGNRLLLRNDFPRTYESISDGPQYTILAVERGNDFQAWGDPTSLEDPQKIIGPDKVSSFADGNQALMCDGSVRLISKDIDPAILKALSTPSSADSTGDF